MATYLTPFIRSQVSNLIGNGDGFGLSSDRLNMCNVTTFLPAAFHLSCKGRIYELIRWQIRIRELPDVKSASEGEGVMEKQM